MCIYIYIYTYIYIYILWPRAETTGKKNGTLRGTSAGYLRRFFWGTSAGVPPPMLPGTSAGHPPPAHKVGLAAQASPESFWHLRRTSAGRWTNPPAHPLPRPFHQPPLSGDLRRVPPPDIKIQKQKTICRHLRRSLRRIQLHTLATFMK